MSSATTYLIGVGSLTNPDTGVKVIIPVSGLTLHVPSPATVTLLTRSAEVKVGSTSCTVLGSILL